MKELFAAALAAALVLTQVAEGQANSGVCEPMRERTRVPLQPMSDAQYRFYYRLDDYVVYIEPQYVEQHFQRGPLPDRKLAQRVTDHGPLTRHTDVFEPFLDSYSAWHALRYMLANVLETGTAAVARRGSEPVSEIFVEKYRTSSCSSGRRFLAPNGEVVYGIIDAEA